MTEKIIEILKENETLTGCKEYFLVKRKDYQKVANEIEVAINYTHCCESDSEQLHTEVFKLANKLAINGYGNEAVKMHQIYNGM